MTLFYKFLKHLFAIVFFGYFIYVFLHYLHMLNPIEKVWADFKFSDIYFGYFQEPDIDDDIYFIDIGMQDNITTRKEISEFINTINQNYKPKVIGVDVDFKIDAAVSDAINTNLTNSLNNDNVVLSYSLMNINNKWMKDNSELPIDYSIVRDGFTNNLIAAKGVDFGVERFFKPAIVQDGDTLKHFAIVMAEKMNIDCNKFLLKENNKVMINFKYKYNNPIKIGDVDNYYKLKDKVVIIGLFTQNKEGDPLYSEDVHYTPSNKHYFGKSPPNMYGGEVLATIISNIKHNNFIRYYKNLSKWLTYFLAFSLYVSLLYFLGKSHNMFIATTIIQQFGLVTLLVLTSIFFIMEYNMYIDLSALAIFAFFSVEFVGFIDEVIHLVESKIKHIYAKEKNTHKKK